MSEAVCLISDFGTKADITMALTNARYWGHRV